MLDELTAAHFHPHVDRPYRLVPHEGDPIDAVLTEVVEHGGSAEGHRAPFSVFFKAPTGAAAPQGIFRVERENVEFHDLFLVPVQQDAGGTGVLYQAVFS